MHLNDRCLEIRLQDSALRWTKLPEHGYLE